MDSIRLQKVSCHLFILLFSTLLLSNSLEAAWSPPVVISQINVDSRFNALKSAAGDTVAVWLTFDSSDNSDVLFSSTRSGGVWSTPVVISSSTARVIDPILVVDSNNDAVLVWTSYGFSSAQLLAARLPFGGSWTTPVTIYSAGSEIIEPTSTYVTTNSIGETIVIWTVFNGTNFLIRSSAFTP